MILAYFACRSIDHGMCSMIFGLKDCVNVLHEHGLILPSQQLAAFGRSGLITTSKMQSNAIALHKCSWLKQGTGVSP